MKQLAAMLFAVHPVHAEAVNSVYNRSDMLVTTLVTLALLLAVGAVVLLVQNLRELRSS